MKLFYILPFLFLLGLFGAMGAFAGAAEKWRAQWPNTDFSKSIIDFDSVISGGPPKDGIPSIDSPRFKKASKIDNLDEKEPVILLSHQGQTKAYPLSILMWHEIVNDRIGDKPVAVTYCPLCHSAIVFSRQIKGEILEFGVSGKLRHSDMIMYDRQTESWWQQYTGQAIVGDMTGERLKRIASRIIPFEEFRSAWPEGKVLIPPSMSMRRYGQNPYAGYDTSRAPFLYKGDYEGPGNPLSYVIFIDDEAWLLSDLRGEKEIRTNNLKLKWKSGMNSSLDNKDISKGRDIGYVEVFKKDADGNWRQINHEMSFAFAFKEFYPEGNIHQP